MASGEVPSEALQLQTWVLKVSIHCEACSKKVRKILRRVEGVCEIIIDSQQNKVTVTGNVDAETLIRKLLKAGKHAELWPQMRPNNPNPDNQQSKGKNKDKAPSKSNESSETPEKKQPESEEKGKAAADVKPPAAKSKQPTTKPTEIASQANSEVPESSGKEAQKSDGKKDADSASLPPEKEAAVPEDGEQAAGGGGKKKGKKGQKDNNEGGNSRELAAMAEEFEGNSATAAGISRPHYPVYHQPPAYPQPSYTMSYNTAHPSPSYSYYAAAAAAPTTQSYMYPGHPPPESYPPVYYQQEPFYGPPGEIITPPSQGSYDMFSDENANSCNVM